MKTSFVLGAMTVAGLAAGAQLPVHWTMLKPVVR